MHILENDLKPGDTIEIHYLEIGVNDLWIPYEIIDVDTMTISALRRDRGSNELICVPRSEHGRIWRRKHDPSTV